MGLSSVQAAEHYRRHGRDRKHKLGRLHDHKRRSTWNDLAQTKEGTTQQQFQSTL